MLFTVVLAENIYVIHRLVGPCWEKLCPLAVLKTSGTVCPNTNLPAGE